VIFLGLQIISKGYEFFLGLGITHNYFFLAFMVFSFLEDYYGTDKILL